MSMPLVTAFDATDGVVVVSGVLVGVGLIGVLVPVLPGSALVVGGILLWAADTGTTSAWIVFSVATTCVAIGTVAKWVLPGRSMRAGGVPISTLLVGSALGLAGFFVIPVVGLLVGFVLGVYLAELQRVGRDRAWPATKHALKAVGLSILIELTAALLAAGTWVAGLVLR